MSFSDDDVFSDSSYSADSSVGSSDLDEFIMSTNVSGSLGKKKGRKTNRSIPAAISELVGLANSAFFKKDFNTAIDLLEEAVRLAPGVAEPFHTLGAIYDEMGDQKRAIESLLLAVHLTPSDSALWKRIAVQSKNSGNIKQAAYCYSRCLRALSSSDQLTSNQRDCLWELGSCYAELGEFEKAAKNLRKLHAHIPEDPVICKELARCLYNLNEKAESVSFLEKAIATTTPDAHLINMLCEVYLDLREWIKCGELLRQYLDFENLSVSPIDLVAKLGIAAANFDRFAAFLEPAIQTLNGADLDLVLPVADALIDNGKFDLASYLLQGAQNYQPIDSQIAVRLGRCLYETGAYEQSAIYLGTLIEDSKGKRLDPNLVIILADCWRRLGKSDEADRLLLERLSYDDLKSCRELPKATSNTARKQILQRLQNLLISHPNLSTDPSLDMLRKKFADSALALLWDNELDFQRVERHRAGGVTRMVLTEDNGIEDDYMMDQEIPLIAFDEQQGRAATSVAGMRATAFWKIRRELDLEGIDEVLGDFRFVDFVEKSSEICSFAGRAKEVIDLLETMLIHKRKRWSVKRLPNVSKTLAEFVEELTFKISCQAGINKVGFKHFRIKIVEALDCGDDTSARIAFSAFSRLAFAPGIFKSIRSSHRELLDQRAWLLRQAVRHPINYCMFMMIGHFCVYSSNYRFAVQEYQRALVTAVNDPFPALCMGSSMLSLAVSRATTDKHFKALSAFALLDKYKKARLAQMEADELTEAEVIFNQARAAHQISMFSVASNAYLKGLKICDGKDCQKARDLRTRLAYGLGILMMDTGNPLGASNVFKKYIQF